MWLTRIGLTLLTTISAGAFAAPAEAASVGVATVESTKVQFKAASGKQNKVVVTRSGNTITIDDVVAVKPGKGCKKVDKTKVRCTTRTAPTRVRIYTYDRNDSIANRSDLGMTADSGTGNDRITGGPRADILRGNRGADRIWGFGGNDQIDGGYDNDLLYGGDGDDVIDDGFGTDTSYGDNGHDTFNGRTGNDKFYGGAGDDIYWPYQPYAEQAKTDADYFSGGSGHDTAAYSAYYFSVTLDADGVRGDDGIKGERDTLAADIETLVGTTENDRLYGTARDDSFFGLGGDDVIYGGDGNDHLRGQEGRDKLYGGSGDDILDGDDGEIDNAADLLDAGSNSPSGDVCYPSPNDVRVGCEILN